MNYAGETQAVGATLTVSSGAIKLTAAQLRQLCMDAGADDVGFVELHRPALDTDRADIQSVLPTTRTVIGLVKKMGRENIRSTLRSVANTEFHAAGHEVNEIERTIVRRLESLGVRAAYAPMGFPMEMDRFGEGKIWVVSHKIVAEQAGLGVRGIHRNVIHPRFGNFVLLGTVFADCVLDTYSTPIDNNPCMECKLCVAACPVGAIESNGDFHWAVCATHNYREFLGGFVDWVDAMTDEASALGYSRRYKDHETVSMWQSLAFGPNYKAAYCLSVCPAGEDVIGPFLADKKAFIEETVRPLQDKEEAVYVVKGSDAEAHVAKRFPRKHTRLVGTGLRPRSAAGFLEALPWLFSTRAAGDLRAVYRYRFRGEETIDMMVTIADGRVRVEEPETGGVEANRADVTIDADSRAWVSFIRGERSIVRLILTRKVRVRGSIRLLQRFEKCFPS